jgi:hypothetical protein
MGGIFGATGLMWRAFEPDGSAGTRARGQPNDLGLMRCRAEIIAEIASPLYSALSLSGAETRKPLPDCWLRGACLGSYGLSPWGQQCGGLLLRHPGGGLDGRQPFAERRYSGLVLCSAASGLCLICRSHRPDHGSGSGRTSIGHRGELELQVWIDLVGQPVALDTVVQRSSGAGLKTSANKRRRVTSRLGRFAVAAPA